MVTLYYVSSSTSLGSIREDEDEDHCSLQSILVTKELSRSSVRVERVGSDIKRPDEVYEGGKERERGWSCTEVRGGGVQVKALGLDT